MNPELLLRTGTRRRADTLEPDAWVQVRQGVFYPSGEWAALHAEARHALLVHASVPRWSQENLVSHWSAAALWGMPTIGGWPSQVHVTAPGQSRSTQHGLRVHRVQEMPNAVDLDGLQLTDPVRTVLDLARCTPLRSGLATADHALREGLITKRALLEATGELPRGHRGRSKAWLVAELVDARAASPLESMSRAVMFENRLPRPDLQVRFRDAAGFVGITDFGWEGLAGECDGEMKYGADLSNDDPSAAVWAEKLREDRLRRQVGLARWSWSDAFREIPMLRILTEKGLRPSPNQLWFT